MERIIDFYKEHQRSIKTISLFIGLILFAVTLVHINTDTISKETIIHEWINQLPEDHFLKSDDASGDFVEIPSVLMAHAKGAEKTAEKIAVRQMGKAGKVYNLVKFFHKNDIEYSLENADGKKIKKITLIAGNTEAITFRKGKEELSFVLTEEDLICNSLDSSKLISEIIPSDYVMASVENTDVATIDENIISGKMRGTSILRLYIDHNIYEYEVIVD